MCVVWVSFINWIRQVKAFFEFPRIHANTRNFHRSALLYNDIFPYKRRRNMTFSFRRWFNKLMSGSKSGSKLGIKLLLLSFSEIVKKWWKWLSHECCWLWPLLVSCNCQFQLQCQNDTKKMMSLMKSFWNWSSLSSKVKVKIVKNKFCGDVKHICWWWSKLLEKFWEKIKFKMCSELAQSSNSRTSYYANPHPEEMYRVHRTLDNLGGGYLLKRNMGNMDSLGGGYLLKRSSNDTPRGSAMDSLGGGYLL